MGFDGFCSCFGGWFSFAGCNQHFCNASVCRLFVYQKSQLWQPGGTPSPATPSLYRLPLVLVSIFNLIFPAAISLCLLWLRFFLTFNFLSFLPCFFFFFCILMHDKTHLTDDGCTYTNQSRTQICIYPAARIFACNELRKHTRCSFVSCSASTRNWSVKNCDTSDCALWRIGAKKERIWQGLARSIHWGRDQ